MSGKEFVYITTAIDYANGPPHMGHALEKIGADAMARYRRLKGERVHFLTGTDEHGLKVLQSAEAANVSPTEWVDALAERFHAAWDRLSIGYDDFIRTTEPRHRRAVESIVERIQAAGDIFKQTYAGYYCVGCEAFKREDELVPAEGERAPDPAALTPGAEVEGLRCPIHPARRLIWMEEENHFFRLSAYQDRLLRLLDERPEFVQPETRRNEVRRVIEGGLEDVSVSRARLPWGVPWPGDPDQTVYVWVDALINYLSAIGFPDEAYHAFWPADYHVIGKDITRFHCIIWPAMLMSAGIELPRTVWAHGWVTVGSRKLSKSEGVSLTLDDAIERHGPDALRYFLLREVPWNGDGEFSPDRFDERYTADLANNLGNLANRVLSLLERYRDGTVPAAERTELDRAAADAVLRYRTAMDANLLHQGAAAAFELADASNAFIEERAPWRLAREPDGAPALDATLASLTRAVVALAVMLSPFMPNKMADLAARFAYDSLPLLPELADLEPAGRSTRRGDVLFPREMT